MWHYSFRPVAFYTYSSKDTFVKFWDLDTQHCFKTLVDHRSEVCDFVVIKDDTRLVTGSADSELRVWDIDYNTQVCRVMIDFRPRQKKIFRERSGSVVECLTRDRRAAGSSLTGVTMLWSLSKTHLS